MQARELEREERRENAHIKALTYTRKACEGKLLSNLYASSRDSVWRFTELQRGMDALDPLNQV